MNLAQWLKGCYLKYKRQRWDFCEELTVKHFAIKCEAVKFVKPLMYSHFSESRDTCYVDDTSGPQRMRRDPNLGGETFHSGSRNNINLHFKLAILIRQNKCNRLLFYVLSFIQFCARKLLVLLVVLKVIFIYKIFSTKLYPQEMFMSRAFRTIV